MKRDPVVTVRAKMEGDSRIEYRAGDSHDLTGRTGAFLILGDLFFHHLTWASYRL